MGPPPMLGSPHFLCEESSLINLINKDVIHLEVILLGTKHPGKIDEINHQLWIRGWRRPCLYWEDLRTSSLGLGFCNPPGAASFLRSEWRLWGFHLYRCNMSSKHCQTRITWICILGIVPGLTCNSYDTLEPENTTGYSTLYLGYSMVLACDCPLTGTCGFGGSHGGLTTSSMFLACLRLSNTWCP